MSAHALQRASRLVHQVLEQAHGVPERGPLVGRRAGAAGAPGRRCATTGSAARVRRPSAVSLTRTMRRSVSSSWRATSPAASSPTTILVMLGGCTCSDAASSPRVGVPRRSTVARAETCDEVTPPGDLLAEPARQAQDRQSHPGRHLGVGALGAGAVPRRVGRPSPGSIPDRGREGPRAGGSSAIVVIVHHSN